MSETTSLIFAFIIREKIRVSCRVSQIDKPAVSFYHFIMCLTFMTAFLAGILNKKGLCKL